METNRAHRPDSGRQDVETISDFGVEDSIVDRVLAMPLPASASHDGVMAWQNGIARRAEKMLSENMRARIENQAERRA